MECFDPCDLEEAVRNDLGSLEHFVKASEMEKFRMFMGLPNVDLTSEKSSGDEIADEDCVFQPSEEEGESNTRPPRKFEHLLHLISLRMRKVRYRSWKDRVFLSMSVEDTGRMTRVVMPVSKDVDVLQPGDALRMERQQALATVI